MKFEYPLSPDPDEAASPVVGWFTEDPSPQSFPEHAHRRGQLLSVSSGLVVVHVAGSVWVVPPNRAAWIPPGTAHAVRYPRGVAMRSLFVDLARFATRLPAQCTVVELDPLSRELVREIADFQWDEVLRGANIHLVQALLSRLAGERAGPIFLPAGRDPRVVKTMDWLKSDPARNERAGELARRANCSSRTLARLFLEDTGMSLGVWRTQLRMQKALELLAARQPVTNVAIELGYDPASFSTAFKRTLGVSPKHYFA